MKSYHHISIYTHRGLPRSHCKPACHDTWNYSNPLHIEWSNSACQWLKASRAMSQSLIELRELLHQALDIVLHVHSCWVSTFVRVKSRSQSRSWMIFLKYSGVSMCNFMCVYIWHTYVHIHMYICTCRDSELLTHVLLLITFQHADIFELAHDQLLQFVCSVSLSNPATCSVSLRNPATCIFIMCMCMRKPC
jgi:hypothetical protein